MAARRQILVLTLALGFALAAAACEPAARPSLTPPAADRAPAPDLAPHVGETYEGFAAQPHMDQYALAALGLSDAEQGRFQSAFAVQHPAEMVEGGGAEALVFRGCGAHCSAAAGVVAIDTATGEAFVGVRDEAGSQILAPNERIEALLRLNSQARRWDDPEGWTDAPPTPARQ